jgi:hypothetical protein
LVDKQLVNKQRVTEHGEVYTANREVNAMLDLVKSETERIDSRFLEPACGNGNFLKEVLLRKLKVVESRFKTNLTEYERNSVIAVSSLYGIDILEDNVTACRRRLFNVFDDEYQRLFKGLVRKDCRNSIQFILEQNIIWGNAISLKTVSEPAKPIIFAEWSFINGSMVKRRDFMFSYLVNKKHQLLLFSDENNPAYISQPVKDYPLVHFLRIGDFNEAQL